MNLNQGYSTSGSQSQSWSQSNTAGAAASQTSQQVTAATNASAYNAWREAAEYNAEQARIQREWQERMANTTYQRTVEDMKKAGINPILAAGMGLGTASVSGGASASVSPAEIFNAQTFAEQNSASQSNSSGWSNSESGLMTALGAIGTWVNGMIGAIQSSKEVNIAIEGLSDILNPETKNGGKDGGKQGIIEHNKIVNGNGNPFKKGTFGYEMYELQQKAGVNYSSGGINF